MLRMDVKENLPCPPPASNRDAVCQLQPSTHALGIARKMCVACAIMLTL
jgi:hypothetical protein